MFSICTLVLLISANIPLTAIAAGREELFTPPEYGEAVLQRTDTQDVSLNKDELLQTQDDFIQGEVVVKFKKEKKLLRSRILSSWSQRMKKLLCS